MPVRRNSYDAVAIVLHWTIAFAILGNFALGWWMHHAIEVDETRTQAVNAYQLHKSIGLTVLLLSLLRLGWRLLHRPPPLPAGMPTWERFMAKITHWLFYVLMLGIPFSGWLYVSTQWHGEAALNVPTLWFGLFEVPHLFGLNQLGDARREQLAGLTGETHEVLAFSMLFLVGLHVAAALKHQFISRDAVLGRMLPVFVSQEDKNARRTITLWLGVGLIAAGCIAAYVEFMNPQTVTTGAADGVISSEGNWRIDPAASEIAFIGQHAGSDFRGHFGSWHAALQLDPEQPKNSQIRVSVDTASASDGIKLHDESLPQDEWFDVDNHPQAYFQVTRFERITDSQYAAHGLLRIKDQDVEAGPFTLQLSADKAVFSGQVNIDRAEIDLGMESDPYGEWVSRQITIQVEAVAYPVDAGSE